MLCSTPSHRAKSTAWRRLRARSCGIRSPRSQRLHYPHPLGRPCRTLVPPRLARLASPLASSAARSLRPWSCFGNLRFPETEFASASILPTPSYGLVGCRLLGINSRVRREDAAIPVDLSPCCRLEQHCQLPATVAALPPRAAWALEFRLPNLSQGRL